MGLGLFFGFRPEQDLYSGGTSKGEQAYGNILASGLDLLTVIK